LPDYRAKYGAPESRVVLDWDRSRAGAAAGDTTRDLEAAEGLPVPVLRGSRVDSAEFETPEPPEPPPPPKHPKRVRAPKPPKPPKPAHAPKAIVPDSHELRTIAGQLSADTQRARADARSQLERAVANWLLPDVPRSWKTPPRLIDRIVVRVQVNPVEKDYATVYEAIQTVDFSSRQRERIVNTYQRELVAHRLALLGGGLGFLLVCLAAVAGYIQADEATKGYYTNRLRLVAAAGVGAAGVLIYQVLT
jgi:hypothetical protein